MTERQDAMVVALVAAQGAARSRVETNVLAQLLRLVAGMRGRWYDPNALTEFHGAAHGLVRQGQTVVADMTGSYLDRTLDQIGVKPVRTAILLPERVRDVSPEVQWERPAKEFRRLRVAGVDELEAQVKAEQRAEQLARMDVALAARDAAGQHVRNNPSVIGFRRIIHPERSRFGSCGLCVVAADRVYHKQDLLPLHNDCRCTVLPVTSAHDPGLKLNTADLSAIYSAADSTGRDKLQRTRVTILENGELGPVLANADYTYRDAADVERDTRNQPAAA